MSVHARVHGHCLLTAARGNCDVLHTRTYVRSTRCTLFTLLVYASKAYAANRDAKAAVRWIKANAASLQADPDLIAAIGVGCASLPAR